MLIKNANILPMDAPAVESGFVRVEGGKFTALGPMADCPAPGADEPVLDLGGRLLLPGMIDAHSHIGLAEDSLGAEGDDVNEDSDPVTPHLRALDGINPFDRCFAEAREAGVTCAVVSPGSANPIAGQICAIKTSGRCVDAMVVAEPLAVKFALGENPKMTYGSKQQGPLTRMATAALIREQLYKADRYREDKHLAESDPDIDEPDYDARCEALLPLLRREIRAHFHAHKAYDILTAVRIAEEFELDYTLVHCTEGHLIADILAEKGARAVCGPMICARTKPELTGLTLENCAALITAGVTVAVSTDHPEVPVGFLAASAAVAVAGGMEREQALAAVTIAAARAVGIEERVGSITPGKDADFAVYAGDPLALGTKPEMVFIGGARVV